MTFDHDVVEFIGLLALVALLCFAAYAHASEEEPMKIQNAIIITDRNTVIQMTIDEQADFTGNVVFARDKLPPSLASELINPTSCDDLAEAVRLLEEIPEPNLTDLLTLRKLREWQREAGCPTDPEC